MGDSAHSWTDWKIGEIEKELDRIYSRAEKELEEKAAKYFKRFEDLDAKKRALVDAGKMTETDYQKWRTGKIMTGKHWTEMKQQTARELLKVNETATAYVNDQIPAVYVRNYNQVANGINGQIKGYSFELVDSSTVRRLATDNTTLLPYKYIDGVKDVRWNTQKVNSEILQGILQGDSIPNMAKRLRKVTEMNRTSAIRNARTSCTSAENKGRMDMLHDAEEKGVHTQKGWMATHDSRTRETHADIDGEFVDIDEEFSNGLEYPGDPNGDPAEVYNCRCTLVYNVVGFGQSREQENGQYEYDEEITDQWRDESKFENAEDNDLTEEQKEALEYYVSGEGMWVNDYLRERGDYGEISDDEKSLIRSMEKATEKDKVEADTLYRSVDASAVFGRMSQSEYDDLIYATSHGASTQREEAILEKAKSSIGKPITDNGFLSTTTDKDVAYSWGDFTGSEKPIVLKFDVQDGVRGVDLGFLDVEGEEQREILLQRGLTYTPTKISVEKDEYGDSILVVYAKLFKKGS